MLVQRAKEFGLAADRGLKNMNVLEIANGRSQRLVNLHDFGRSGKEPNELGDFCFGQAEPFEQAGVVKNPLHFFQYRSGENQPMTAIEKFEEERSCRARCPAIGPNKNC